MKKLMISAIAVMLGFAANAAAVTWSIAGIQSSPANTATTGWYVQIFESATSYTYADAKVGNITAWSSAMTTGTTAYKATEKVLDAADKGDTVAIYAVIYDAASIADAKYYIVSDVASKTIDDDGADITISFGSMKGTSSSNKFLNSQWQPVPEPTSSLLLLIGMGALALRRKRA